MAPLFLPRKKLFLPGNITTLIVSDLFDHITVKKCQNKTLIVRIIQDHNTNKKIQDNGSFKIY